MSEQINILIRNLHASHTSAKLSIENRVLISGQMTSTTQKEQVAYLGPPSSYSNQVEHVPVAMPCYIYFKLTNPRRRSTHSTRTIMFLYRNLPSKVSQAIDFHCVNLTN